MADHAVRVTVQKFKGCVFNPVRGQKAIWAHPSVRWVVNGVLDPALERVTVPE